MVASSLGTCEVQPDVRITQLKAEAKNSNFGIALPSLIKFLNGNDVPYAPQASSTHIDKVDLAELARESTVLLQCYQ